MNIEKETTGHKEINKLYFSVAPGIWGTKDVFVNMYIIQNLEDGNWVLVDTGLKSSAVRIKRMAEKLFGPESRPSAILLTHGHFDHTGSLKKLLQDWDTPVYCHYLELPYLSGKSAYPPPDPTVGGGLLSSMSWMYPKRPVNIESYLNILPPDGSVPFLPGWQYIHTPGHAPGHVSLFREEDRVLIAGDAFVTTRQESVTSVMLQQRKISGPPKYLTYDWEAAKHSVETLAALHPDTVATGHGRPMEGPGMQYALYHLAENFDEIAVPNRGRYVNEAAIADASGILYLPPKPVSVSRVAAIGAAAGVVGALLTLYLVSRRKAKA